MDEGKKLAKALLEVKEALRREAVRRAAVEAGELVADTARRLAPVRTGTLRRSIEVKVEHGERASTVEVAPNRKVAWYAHLVEFGAARHVILPKNRKALKTPAGVYRQVVHPGHAPRPFMRPAWDAAQDEVRQIVARAAGRALRRSR